MNQSSSATGDGGAFNRPLQIAVERRPDAAVVRLAGVCSMDVSGRVLECLAPLATEPVERIVVEMSDLEFIDSTGLGGLIAGYLKARRNRRPFALVNPRRAIYEVLETTRLTRLFPVYPDVQAAISAPDPHGAD